MLKSVKENASNLLAANFDEQNPVDEAQVKAAFEHLSGKFNNDEMVQVIENYLEKKNLQELQQLMLALFEERAKGLRRHVMDMMGQKQTELELIREEYRPRFEGLKDRRAKGLVSEQAYKSMVEELTKEEAAKKVDVEIAMGELEQKMEEELQL